MSDTETFTENGKTHQLGALPKDGVVGMSGMDIFEHMLAGNLPAPPIMLHSNIRLKEFSEGRAVFTGLPEKQFLNPMGTIHGGWISTLIDTALSCAVHTKLAPGEIYTTTSLTVNMVRPLMAGSGLVTCEGRVVHRGRKLATSEGDLKDANGKLIAHGTVTCMIMPMA
ncbi:MAG: PaaI family thioesterase [Roseibium sp.]